MMEIPVPIVVVSRGLSPKSKRQWKRSEFLLFGKKRKGCSSVVRHLWRSTFNKCWQYWIGKTSLWQSDKVLGGFLWFYIILPPNFSIISLASVQYSSRSWELTESAETLLVLNPRHGHSEWLAAFSILSPLYSSW